MIIRKSLVKKIEKLENMLLKMYDITRAGLDALSEMTKTNNIELLKKTEEESDKLNWDIFEESITTIATQQPTARDLRFVIMAPTISSTQERINDLLLDIAESYIKIPEVAEWFRETIIQTVEILKKMLEVTKNAMINRTFIDIPDKLTNLDDKIDVIFDKTISDLEQRDLEKRTIIRIAYIMRDLERIGDLIGKIGSRIVYIETGKMIPIK